MATDAGAALSDPMDKGLREASRGVDAEAVARALFGAEGQVCDMLAAHPERVTAIAQKTSRLLRVGATEFLAELSLWSEPVRAI